MNRGRHKKNKVDDFIKNKDLAFIWNRYSEYKLYHCDIIFYKNYKTTKRWKFNIRDGEELFHELQTIISEKLCDRIHISFEISIFGEKYKKIKTIIYVK